MILSLGFPRLNKDLFAVCDAWFQEERTKELLSTVVYPIHAGDYALLQRCRAFQQLGYDLFQVAPKVIWQRQRPIFYLAQ